MDLKLTQGWRSQTAARTTQRLFALCGGLVGSLMVSCMTPASPPESAPAAPSPPTTDAATTSPVSPPRDLPVVNAPQPLAPAAMWQQLQQPEEQLYVVLLRHALAPGTGDPDNFQLEDCTTQRNLSDEGRTQAQAIGQAFRDRGVAVQQVLSSQWCRCLETAELMAIGEVQPFTPLNSFFRDRTTAATQTTEVKNYLAAAADTPGVIVMVTHQVNITALTDIVPQSGEAVVLRVTSDQLTQIGQFRPER